MVTKSLPRGEGDEPPTASVIFPHDRFILAGISWAGFSAAFSVLAAIHSPHGLVSKQHKNKRLMVCMGQVLRKEKPALERRFSDSQVIGSRRWTQRPLNTHPRR